MNRQIVTMALTAFAAAFGIAQYGNRLMGQEPAAPAGMSASASTAQRPAATPSLTVSADYNGHFTVYPTIDRLRVRMLVDTGASVVALTDADARSLGLKPAASEYRVAMSTANGVVRAARVHLDEVRLGDIVVRRVEAVVMPPGALGISLLGTSFLRRLHGYEVQSGRMILRG